MRLQSSNTIISLPLLMLAISRVSSGSLAKKIYHGTEVEVGQYPFMVSVQLKNKYLQKPQKMDHTSMIEGYGKALGIKKSVATDQVRSSNEFLIQSTEQVIGGHLCGGALIAKQWVLTAYQCVDPKNHGDPSQKNTSLLEVVLGNPFLKNESTIANQLVLDVSQVKIHARNGVKHDIALLKLSREVEESENIKIARLPKHERYFANLTGIDCIVMGWGDRHFSEENQDNLHETKISLVNPDDYREAIIAFYSLTEEDILLKPNRGGILFALGEKTDTCWGDSGGPLMCPDKNGQLVVAGIVSFGGFSCSGNFPGVYTNVELYAKWINDTINA